MTSVVIYLVYHGKEEIVEFLDSDTPEVVRSLFQTVAGAEPEDDLKLYNEKGHLIVIYGKMKPNDPATHYELKVIPKAINKHRLLSLIPAAAADLDRVVHRLSQIEKTVTECEMPETLVHLHQKYNHIIVAINGLKYLTFLRITDDMIPKGRQRVMVAPFWWQPSAPNIARHRRQITELFSALLEVGISQEVREGLRQPTFDNWECTDAHMLAYILHMFRDLGLVDTFNMDEQILHNFLIKVYYNYNFLPFHNIRHCFSVTQMMFSLIWNLDLNTKLDQVDIFTLLTTAICHDLDHNGYSNNFHKNSNSRLYAKHQDSTLENHHVEVALEILNDETCSIDQFLPPGRRQPFRDLMTKIILATDLNRCKETLDSLNAITDLDLTNEEHKHVVMTALIEVSDISNEARKSHISGPWVDCLLQEFFTQHEVETMENLPTAEFMDKDKVTKPSAQIGFIKGLLLPKLEAVRRFFPKIQELIDVALENLKNYTELQLKFDPEGAKKAETASKNAGNQDDKNGSTTPDSDDKNGSTTPGGDDKNGSTTPSGDGKNGSTTQSGDGKSGNGKSCASEGEHGFTLQEINPAVTTQDQAPATQEVNPSAPTQDQAPATQEVNPSAPTQDQAPATQEVNPSAPTQDQAPATQEVNPSALTQDQAPASQEVNPSAPTQDQAPATQEGNPSAPTQDQASASQEVNPSAPTQDQAPATQEVNPSAPTQDQAQTTPQE